MRPARFAGLLLCSLLAGCQGNAAAGAADPVGTFEGQEGTIKLSAQGDFTLTVPFGSAFGKKSFNLGQEIPDSVSKGTWKLDGDTLHLMPTTWNGEPIEKSLEMFEGFVGALGQKPEEVEKMKKAARDMRGNMSSDRKTIFLPVPHGTAMFLKE